MVSSWRGYVISLGLGMLGCAGAQPVPAPVSVPLAANSAARSASAPTGATQVLEDDQVRIEESRARGQLQRVTVRNKASGTAYEIIVSPAGRDPSQARGASGQRAWSLFDF